jgi:hypothetical protein
LRSRIIDWLTTRALDPSLALADRSTLIRSTLQVAPFLDGLSVSKRTPLFASRPVEHHENGENGERTGANEHITHRNVFSKGDSH